jgi:hypothetical protein
LPAGISLEPLSTIATQPGAGQSAVNTASTFVAFTEAMLTSFCNFAMSFAITPQEVCELQIPAYRRCAAVGGEERLLLRTFFFSKTAHHDRALYVLPYLFPTAQMLDRPNEQYVPMSAVNRWFEKFKHNLQINPNFWKSANAQN